MLNESVIGISFMCYYDNMNRSFYLLIKYIDYYSMDVGCDHFDSTFCFQLHNNQDEKAKFEILRRKPENANKKSKLLHEITTQIASIYKKM